jgi:hypothetical protein
MSLDGSYDMVLLPLPRDNNNVDRQPARRWRNQRRLPRVVEEQHPGLSRHLPHRRRRRRATMAKQEAAPHRLSSESTMSAPQRGTRRASTSRLRRRRASFPCNTPTPSGRMTPARSRRTCWALASYLRYITVQSVPDATPSPSVDQEVPSVFHPVPFRYSFDPPSDPASVDAFIKAYPNLAGYHMWSTWDRLMAVSTYGPPGSEEDDEPDYGWDFSGLGNPSAMRDFMTACDYCLSDCSDGSHSLGDEDCGPSHECFHVDLGGSRRRQPPWYAGGRRSP